MNVGGTEARAVVEPRDAGDLAALVRECYAAERSFAFVGGGTDIDLGNAPATLDTVVRTTNVRSVIEYAPEDQTITVEAGMTLAALSAVLAEHGQFLPIDAPDPERATVGGAIATNRFGRLRTRYGSIKDNIVGIEIVRPDGVVAHGGGKVVKNVAGFDIPKLMVGSLGTLGAITRATFRVHPIEPASAAVVHRGLRAADVMRTTAAIVDAALVPTSIVAYDDGERFDVVVCYDGFERGVEQQQSETLAIAQRANVAADILGPSDRERYDQRDRAARASGAWRVRIGAAPAALGAFVASGALHGLRTAFHPFLGAAFVAGDDLDGAIIERWRAALPGGTVVIAAMPVHARGAVDAWGAPPQAFAIMQRLKANFDPKHLCNPGRFVGGL